MEDYPVYGPAKNKGPIEVDNEYSFKEIDTIEEVSLQHPPTMIPPKQFFFPRQESLLEIENSEVHVPEVKAQFVILGVHACDINSFLILDEMFSHGPHEDPYYNRRREQGIVIGIDCEPTEYCFCDSMGAKTIEKGYDLFFTHLPSDEGFIVTIGSETGENLTSSERFEPVDTQFAKKIIKESQEWEEDISVDTQELSEITSRAFDDASIWEDLGEKCLACGNCTMVCPCCNCFDVKDVASLESAHVTRHRTWNACTLLEFAEVAGGNFRTSTQSRYRNWFYDKYRIFPKDIEEFGCVGCGRCVKYCPVDIDPRKIIQEVREKHA